MAMELFRVCLLMVTAIINHPLLFPRENATVPENEEEIIRKMQEHQEKLQMEQLRLEEELSRLEAEKEALQQVEEEEEQQQPEARTTLDLWSTLCMILFLIIEVWRQDHQEGTFLECQGGDEDDLSGLGYTPMRGLPLPNRATLDHFYEHCIRSATGDATRTREFVEGFVDDLLEALRSTCNRNTDMGVEDFIGVGSMYENCHVERPLLCHLFVPFIPPEPYSFHPEVWCSSLPVPLERQGYGQIKVTLADGDPLGCICGKTELEEEMLCLLHVKNRGAWPSSAKNSEAEDLCPRESSYLDAIQIMKWFQMALTRAWHRIAHKYEFDLAFAELDTPGSLKIRFRSGKFMPFILTPVIQYNDSDLYFISQFSKEPRRGALASSTDWLPSFAVYERQFLRMIARTLPEGACHLSCLQIASFLLSKQTCLTGPSGLSDYHLKTALLHLLLSQQATDWKASQLDVCLQEFFSFLERSLLEKKLHHFFVGNHKVPEALNLPEVVRRAEPVNLFRPFVLQRTLYRNTVDSFYEMLKNAPTLISEYSLHVPSDRASPPPKAVAL